ncbi:unnamed protein product [Brachionus calyciflorus]|uniref:Uncharacterized protein n=1 Tax=Brachionus calyciflorus TaxID=104777 RepID=A0A813R277_9BILA|nr:unnamed protein product [Brachionus calyciflorus]
METFFVVRIFLAFFFIAKIKSQPLANTTRLANNNSTAPSTTQSSTTSQYAPYGSCLFPIAIDFDLFSQDNKTQILGFLSQDSRLQTKLPCSDSLSSHVAYSFEIPTDSEVYFEFKMFSFDKTNKMDTVLALGDSNCQVIQNWCNDDSVKTGGLSSFVSGVLKNGNYKLLASGYDNTTLGPYLIDFLTVPIQVGKISSIKLSQSTTFEYSGNFTANRISIKFDCMNKIDNLAVSSFNYMVFTIEVPEKKQARGWIQVNGFKNKLDTFIQIRDEFNKQIHGSEFCNDDSPLVGGLSSLVEPQLNSGLYRVTIGALGLRNSNAQFNLKLDFRVI